MTGRRREDQALEGERWIPALLLVCIAVLAMFWLGFGYFIWSLL